MIDLSFTNFDLMVPTTRLQAPKINESLADEMKRAPRPASGGTEDRKYAAVRRIWDSGDRKQRIGISGSPH
jgi:hypothetical protein